MPRKRKPDKSVERATKATADTVKESSGLGEMKSKSGVKKWLIPGAVLLGGILLAGYLTRGVYISAIVNGRPIYRYELVKELEKQSGKQLLEQKITERLILAEAEKQGASIAEEDLDKEIAEIEKQVSLQGQELDALLAQKGLTRAMLREQIRMQKLIEALIPTGEAPSDEEVMAMVEAQADTFPKDMTEEERKTAVKNQLTQQSKSESVDTWLLSLRDGARIEYVGNY